MIMVWTRVVRLVILKLTELISHHTGQGGNTLFLSHLSY